MSIDSEESGSREGAPRKGGSVLGKGLLDRIRSAKGTAEALRRATSPPAPAADEAGAPEPTPDEEAGNIRLIRKAGRILGIPDPFFKLHDGIAGATTRLDGESFVNFSSYDYLGLNGHPAVKAAAIEAIERFGTSVSASRLVSGERPFHRELEAELAAHYGAEQALTFVSGHATNVSAIAQLVGPGDLLAYDSLSHNSIVMGAKLSGARRLPFPHNDLDALDQMLARSRKGARRTLVAVEGMYSMDGDIPDLPRLIEIVRRHGALLFVDEAHSLGALGPRGFGLAEHYGIDPAQVDVWMGTLSKTLVSSGGYVAGKAELIDLMKVTASGFVYSVGLAPPVACAALAALRILHAEPGRVRRLQENGALFLAAARRRGLDTGTSIGRNIVPVVAGSSIRAARLAGLLDAEKVNVQPILYPAVPEQTARLRFFLSSSHTPEQIEAAVETVARLYAGLPESRAEILDLARIVGAV